MTKGAAKELATSIPGNDLVPVMSLALLLTVKQTSNIKVALDHEACMHPSYVAMRFYPVVHSCRYVNAACAKHPARSTLTNQDLLSHLRNR